MTFKQSLYLSFAVHILIFGSAIAIANYATGMLTSLSRTIEVSLVDSGPSSGRESRTSRKLQSRPSEAPPLTHHPTVRQESQVPQEIPPEVSTTSLLPSDGKGATDNNDKGHDGGQVISPAEGGDGGSSGFGLIGPEQWAAIESAIERTKNYPRLARERGIEGVVRLRFRLDQRGAVEKIEILESSGSEILDNASVRTVYRAAPLPAVNGWVEMPMKYVLK